MSGMGIKRGALIVLEGCDRVGKSTQCRLLVEKLLTLGCRAQMLQFPDRSTNIGAIISNYLSKKEELPDKAVHLLFSANRWESQPEMTRLIYEGVTLVVDRYSISGVAYSAAKPGIDLDWCKKPEIGLPKPDLVFFLHMPSGALGHRSGFGEERYEKKEFLDKVYANYLALKDDTWVMVDGSKSIEEVLEQLLGYARETIMRVETKDLEQLW